MSTVLKAPFSSSSSKIFFHSSRPRMSKKSKGKSKRMMANVNFPGRVAKTLWIFSLLALLFLESLLSFFYCLLFLFFLSPCQHFMSLFSPSSIVSSSFFPCHLSRTLCISLSPSSIVSSSSFSYVPRSSRAGWGSMDRHLSSASPRKIKMIPTITSFHRPLKGTLDGSKNYGPLRAATAKRTCE